MNRSGLHLLQFSIGICGLIIQSLNHVVDNSPLSGDDLLRPVGVGIRRGCATIFTMAASISFFVPWGSLTSISAREFGYGSCCYSLVRARYSHECGFLEGLSLKRLRVERGLFFNLLSTFGPVEPLYNLPQWQLVGMPPPAAA